MLSVLSETMKGKDVTMIGVKVKWMSVQNENLQKGQWFNRTGMVSGDSNSRWN